jgi:REP element-mobilizing transposase RayT
MTNSYSSHFIHVVFSTKNRRRLISKEIELEVWTFMGGIASDSGVTPIQIGGIEDHVHLLLMTRPTVLSSKLVQKIKGESSHWISSRFPNLKTFRWQDGYSIFSVSRSAVSKVESYIKNQRAHHSRIGFEDEYRKMLELHRVDIVDKKYLFG